jgi:DNA-binding PadR family transcriptional regulator
MMHEWYRGFFGEHRMHRHLRRKARWHRYEPWGPQGRFFGPGEVRLALLSLLSAGPQHGYELMRQLEERSDGAYRASAGTVYPTLQQLEDEGLVRSESADGKRVYRLTAEGERVVADQAEAIRRIWRRAEAWGDFGFAREPDAAEIARPAFRLARAAFRAVTRSEGDPRVIERVRDVLERARKEIEDLS